MDKILPKKDFPLWLKNLSGYALYAPRLVDEAWSYELVTDPASISLDYSLTAVPAKKIIFPQRESYFEFSEDDTNGYRLAETLPEEKPVVIFGVRPCEGRALTLTDKVFGGEFEDLYYWKRRRAVTLVGLACGTPPSPNCFCLSVDGSPHSREGLDILLTDLGDKYYVEALTSKGEDLLAKGGAVFAAPPPEDKKAADKIHADSEKKLGRRLENIKDVPCKLRGMFDSSFWDEESLSCIRCGICTYLCPTCHCFDINDEVESASPLRGRRVRTWDTCQFPDFTMHSSGHNPRPDKSSRLRQRINHKFQYFQELWQNWQCTGCGRCITLCPVGIDIVKVVEKVRDHAS
jgi:sulfhydrogenase subunit beta (sulfur reductase)